MIVRRVFHFCLALFWKGPYETCRWTLEKRFLESLDPNKTITIRKPHFPNYFSNCGFFAEFCVARLLNDVCYAFSKRDRRKKNDFYILENLRYRVSLELRALMSHAVTRFQIETSRAVLDVVFRLCANNRMINVREDLESPDGGYTVHVLLPTFQLIVHLDPRLRHAPHLPLAASKHATPMHFLAGIASVREKRIIRIMDAVLDTAPGRACLEIRDIRGRTPSDVSRSLLDVFCTRQELLDGAKGRR